MSYDRRRLYENNESWEKDVPADLIPAIKHLRNSFEDFDHACGYITKKICYSSLHNERVDDPHCDYLACVLHIWLIKARNGDFLGKRFEALARQQTLPAIFKASSDLYRDAVTVQALVIFEQLRQIGRANEERLGIPHLEWAAAQTAHLIRSRTQTIKMWVTDACNKYVYDPEEEPDEMVFWRKWQAPEFVIMEPSGSAPYDPARTWKRQNCETSLKWLNSFAQDAPYRIRDNECVGGGRT